MQKLWFRARLGALILLALAGRADAGETTTYTYDALGRLTGITSTGSDDSNQSVISYDPAGNRTSYTVTTTTAGIAIGNASAAEGGNLVFTVTRSGITTNAVSVNYATASGTATSGSDFTAASGTLSFAANETSKTITVATTNDTTVESSETFTVGLSGASSNATITDASGTGTITDNDIAPANLAIGNASAAEGANIVFTVTRSGNTATAVSVNYATAGGTATSGSDFTAASGTLSFAANETSKTITVATTNDTTVESSETFTVGLSGASSNATITDASGTGTITDNDTGFSSTLTSGAWSLCIPGFGCPTYYGYSQSLSIGSMSNTAWGANTIINAYNTSGTITFTASGTVAPPNAGWTSITLPGVGTKLRTAATYSTNGNWATWSWSNSNIVITSGTVTIQ